MKTSITSFQLVVTSRMKILNIRLNQEATCVTPLRVCLVACTRVHETKKFPPQPTFRCLVGCMGSPEHSPLDAKNVQNEAAIVVFESFSFIKSKVQMQIWPGSDTCYQTQSWHNMSRLMQPTKHNLSSTCVNTYTATKQLQLHVLSMFILNMSQMGTTSIGWELLPNTPLMPMSIQGEASQNTR